MYRNIGLLFITIILMCNVDRSYSTTTIDPWLFNQRYQLYESILNYTKVPTLFGIENMGNFLWGLPLQLEWQHNSSRLSTASPISNVIEQKSWWGCMNYFLSVIPYLSAMQMGLVPTVTILPPPVSDNRFCTSYAQCNQSLPIQSWNVYFQQLVQLQQSPELITNTTMESLLGTMWKAHTHSIELAKELFPSELKAMGYKEAKFGNGWANFVEVLAIVLFNTNHTNVAQFGKSLPDRRLVIWDIPPLIPSMSQGMNNVVASIFVVDDMVVVTPLVWDSFLALLKVLMGTPCKSVIQSTVMSFVDHPIDSFINVLISLANQCRQQYNI